MNLKNLLWIFLTISLLAEGSYGSRPVEVEAKEFFTRMLNRPKSDTNTNARRLLDSLDPSQRYCTMPLSGKIMFLIQEDENYTVTCGPKDANSIKNPEKDFQKVEFNFTRCVIKDGPHQYSLGGSLEKINDKDAHFEVVNKISKNNYVIKYECENRNCYIVCDHGIKSFEEPTLSRASMGHMIERPTSFEV